MSASTLPVLPGLAWNVTRAPIWKTKVQQSVSGREVRGAFMSQPLYKFAQSYNFLRQTPSITELQQLVKFFNDRQGMFDTFFYTDPTDNAVTAQNFGTGDGVTTAFQLTRSFGGNAEAVANVKGAPSIYINGALKTVTTDYTISSTGVVTFTVAPAAAAALTWTGSFYYRCRFMQDSLDFINTMSQIWELKKLEFMGDLGGRL